jgi:rod shape determining protein RodA
MGPFQPALQFGDSSCSIASFPWDGRRSPARHGPTPPSGLCRGLGRLPSESAAPHSLRALTRAVLAGVRWLHLALLAITMTVLVTSVLWVLPSAGVQVLKPYQTARLTGFTNPDSDPGGLTYNVTQSRTAVGAGGLSGRGVEGASQTRLDYLPEHATDFVFASFAEQRGFIGTSILLLLYLLVVWRGLRVITVAGDLYGAVVAGGIVFAFLFQVFVNVGMTMGIAPVTGIPLAFVTVGGSSMVANLVALGVLQAIHARGLDESRR